MWKLKKACFGDNRAGTSAKDWQAYPYESLKLSLASVEEISMLYIFLTLHLRTVCCARSTIIWNVL